MTKIIAKHGDNLAIIIDKPILKLLKITETTKLKIKTDGKKIIIEPISAKTKKEKFKEIYEKVVEEHGEDFKKLAED